MPNITGQYFAEVAYSFHDSGYTYDQYDCIAFTNLVRRTCGLSNLASGTNTLWRNGTLAWQGTIAQAVSQFGDMPQGCYLFRIKPENDPTYNDPPIPSQYYMDGIGNVTHVGIYTDIGLGVMQSGGYGGTGVHDSSFNSNYWTHIGLPPNIDYQTSPTPPQPVWENPDLINSFWCSPNLRIGAWSVQTETPTHMQLQNANNIRSMFLDHGWTLQAICGILGNMQAESTLNPAYIQETNRDRLPQNGTNLNLLPNHVMKNFYKEYYGATSRAFGVGLVQWDGYSTSNGERQQKLVAYAIRNAYNWFDGWCQCYRLIAEWQQNRTYHFFNPVTINGTRYTFSSYVQSTNSPTELAHAWQAGYERNAGGIGFRGVNAEWWYDYFTDPDAPPPLDPDDPNHPFDPEPEYPIDDIIISPWVYLFMSKKRKELKPRCQRI